MTGTQPVSVEQLLDFAAAHPETYTGNVGEEIRADLGITPPRYFQLLGRAIATDEALQHDPMTTHRLRRQAEDRKTLTARRLGL